MKKLLAHMKERLRPTAQERAANKKLVTDVLARLNHRILPARAILGGSGAKDTFLRGQFDMDIFCAFPYAQFKDKNDTIATWLEARLRRIFPKMERVHGSRDYFRLRHAGTQFEIIPIIKISRAHKALNITDVSPLHSVWVKKHAKGEMLDEIRLLKAFCKGCGVYGAESYIRGFSGYVCEILTIHYGSFLSVLKASRKWLPGETIDTMKHLRGKPAFMFMNKSKLQSPLIVVDPVQHDRNAAAALDMDAFTRFQQKAAAFLKKPREDYFTRRFLTAQEIKAKFRGKAVVLRVQPLKAKEDVAGTAMHKAFQYLTEKLSENGFSLKDAGWEWDRENHAHVWFAARKEPLPKTREHLGPPAKMKKHADIFRKRYKKTTIKRGRLVATVAREHTTVRAQLSALVRKDEYLKTKARGIEIA